MWTDLWHCFTLQVIKSGTFLIVRGLHSPAFRKIVSATLKTSAKYRQIRARLEKVGLVEPLVVYPLGNDRYELLDGHVRALILQDLGVTNINCLIATEQEAWTSPLPTIHRATPLSRPLLTEREEIRNLLVEPNVSQTYSSRTRYL